MELLTAYSLKQIFIFAIILLVTIRGGWELIDFFKKKYSEKFNKDYSKKNKQQELENHYKECKKQHDETLEIYGKLEGKIDTLTDTVNEKFSDLEKRIDILSESDMHDIKHSIVKDYHYFVEQKGWIDDFNLDTILLRYSDYKKENGNSYIEMLIDEIKKLPKHPTK